MLQHHSALEKSSPIGAGYPQSHCGSRENRIPERPCLHGPGAEPSLRVRQGFRWILAFRHIFWVLLRTGREEMTWELQLRVPHVKW